MDSNVAFERYNVSNNLAHEAGYDAFMTGCLFLRLNSGGFLHHIPSQAARMAEMTDSHVPPAPAVGSAPALSASSLPALPATAAAVEVRQPVAPQPCPDVEVVSGHDLLKTAGLFSNRIAMNALSFPFVLGHAPQRMQLTPLPLLTAYFHQRITTLRSKRRRRCPRACPWLFCLHLCCSP
jgi:hypothetical protein